METSEVIYIDGEAWTREEAEKHLRFLVRQMDELGEVGAHRSTIYSDEYPLRSKEERFNKLKREAVKIEIALGL